MDKEKQEKLMKFQRSSLCFGTDYSGEMQSVAQASYTKKHVDSADRQACHANRLYLRGRHWELGHDHEPKPSTYKQDFPYVTAESSAAEAAKELKKDLQAAHYHLGFGDDPSRFRSVYAADVSDTAAACRVDSSGPVAMVAKKPPTSLLLGTDAMPTQSTCHGDFVDHGRAVDIVDGRAQGLLLRKSHFMLGTDEPTYVTNTAAAHNASVISPPVGPCDAAQSNNVTFGTCKPHYETEFRSGFSRVGELMAACASKSTNERGKELKKDLSGSHFSLGTDQGRYESVAQANYVPMRADKQNMEEQSRIRNAIKQVYLTMGNDPATYESNSAAAFKAPPKALYMEGADGEARQQKKNAVDKAHFTLGTEDDSTRAARECSLQHESMRHGLVGIDYSKLTGMSAEVKADLRRSHFQLGSDAPEHLSNAQRSFVQPPKNVPAAMDPAQLADLRAHHFTFGDETYKSIPGGMSTTAQDQQVYHGQCAAALDPAQKKDLQAVHFTFGNHAMPEKSAYQQAFSKRPGL